MKYSETHVTKSTDRLVRVEKLFIEGEVEEELLQNKISLLDSYKGSFDACSKLYHICIRRIKELEEEFQYFDEQVYGEDQIYVDQLVYKIKCYDNHRIIYKKIAEDLYKNLKETK